MGESAGSSGETERPPGATLQPDVWQHGALPVDAWPRGAVLQAWVLVEAEVARVAEAKGVEWRGSRGAMSLLGSMGVLPPHDLSTLDELRSLRNELRHRPGAEIDATSARRYAARARRLAQALRTVAEDPEASQAGRGPLEPAGGWEGRRRWRWRARGAKSV